MKRIEFIAPVEAMRGNLSGAQKLEYPTENQGAYEGPEGSVNYARNYSPRFIGAKRAADGRKYFSVRTKSANHLTASSKKAMALLGGSGAIYAVMVKAPVIKASMDQIHNNAVELGDKRTFRKHWMDLIRTMLESYAATYRVQIGSASLNLQNPYKQGTGVVVVNDETHLVPYASTIKFLSQLMPGGGSITIEGIPTGVTADWYSVPRSTATTQIALENGYVMARLSESDEWQYLTLSDGTYVKAAFGGEPGTPIVDGMACYLTNVAPA